MKFRYSPPPSPQSKTSISVSDNSCRWQSLINITLVFFVVAVIVINVFTAVYEFTCNLLSQRFESMFILFYLPLTSIVTILSTRPSKGFFLFFLFCTKHCNSSQKSPVQSIESSKLSSCTALLTVFPLFAFQ